MSRAVNNAQIRVANSVRTRVETGVQIRVETDAPIHAASSAPIHAESNVESHVVSSVEIRVATGAENHAASRLLLPLPTLTPRLPRYDVSNSRVIDSLVNLLDMKHANGSALRNDIQRRASFAFGKL